MADAAPATIFVLLGGKRRCGKDTFGAALVRHLGDDSAVLVHLADEMKRRYAAEVSIDYNQLQTNDLLKEWHHPGIIALAMREREIEPAIWVRLLFENCEKKRFVVVCDHRFVVERQYLKNQYTAYFKVTATDETRTQRGWIYNQAIDTHASEVELDQLPTESWIAESWDAVIENNGSSPELDQKAKQVAEYLTIRFP